jgi:hypothetical protein
MNLKQSSKVIASVHTQYVLYLRRPPNLIVTILST